MAVHGSPLSDPDMEQESTRLPLHIAMADPRAREAPPANAGVIPVNKLEKIYTRVTRVWKDANLQRHHSQWLGFVAKIVD